MDIERVNENTIKLFITYRDIEDRGYTREEIWYNRAKGEELFWDMIGEINTEEYFDLDGPIWIHVNASEQGLEVIVTRANVNDGDPGALFSSFEEHEAAIGQKEPFNPFEDDDVLNYEGIKNMSIYKFKDIDEIVPVANRLVDYGLNSSLYKYENDYYVAIDFTGINDSATRQNIRSILDEYLTSSKMTIYRLKEYGTAIMEEDCFETIVHYFD
ncbi:adaptor protein MecA [Ureibacillus sp. FSL K6-8385]|uniref:Adapter protein MecA n=1 Tax=Ureibacillus terrenus TaxID=118246 RepID=A0A540V5E4_9BACL|nr:adaptor protein MecA [Ureibacillus terrenus]MED3763129.1 adaptor protein MecA [Ureibacillus terrenus]TQE91363.1 adaptor protein MecA [Ureibacillus terrenus]